MDSLTRIRELLQPQCLQDREIKAIFFKTRPGEYAEHDQFLGVSVPNLRVIAKEFKTLSLPELQLLISSPYNEERLLALLILINQYQKGNDCIQKDLYVFYLDNLRYVNNWNLVDASAHLILGAYLLHTDKNKLYTLAASETIWERRIAIVATWYFIRQGQLDWTIKIAELLLNDTHDLIHKATGWMLREAGKKDQAVLTDFLDQYAHCMPRTMLRYAIEKLSPSERRRYLNAKQ